MSPATAEHIQVWQRAVIDGRRRVADEERRATYPSNADEDVIALCEYYRIRYHQGRILKALSFFIDVTPADMSGVTGIHPALLTMEVRRVAERTHIKVETVRRQDGSVSFYRMLEPRERDEVRMVINSSWHF